MDLGDALYGYFKGLFVIGVIAGAAVTGVVILTVRYVTK